jgi:hypothetical protein
MATYTVKITGSPHSSYGYVTINGTKYTSDRTYTYTSKPTISVYVSATTSSDRSRCSVSLNGERVKTGYGSYDLSTEATDIEISIGSSTGASGYYYSAHITTSGEPESGDDTGGGSGGGHYTNIGSTSREIESGTVLIGGVLREIETGIVLVGGVAREIAFGPGDATMNVVSKTTNAYAMEIEWDGGSHTDSRKSATYSIPIGTTIRFKIPVSDTIGGIRLNGSIISTSPLPVTGSGSNKRQYYDYVLNGNITVNIQQDAVFAIIEE